MDLVRSIPIAPQPTPCMAAFDRGVWRDVLSQAVTGELVGMLNYMALIELHDGIDEKIQAQEHASSEKAHSRMFLAAAREIGVEVVADVDAPYWRRLRSAFLARARARDLLGCTLVQEVMLETFAVATYRRIGELAPGRLGQTFARIALDEAGHVAHAVDSLRGQRERDATRFDAAVHAAHEDAMSVLAEMVAREDPGGHCGLCQGHCAKASLPCVGIDLSELRGLALRQYLATLDAIGVPGEVSLAWVVQLPV